MTFSTHADVEAAIHALEAQSATIGSQVDIVRANPNYRADGPIVTFVDDDGNPLFHDIWEPLATSKGIKISLAAIGASVTGDPTSSAQYPSMSLAELQAIEADGHDILSHGWLHYASYDAAVTTAMLDADYTTMSAWMRDNFPATAHIHVYPGGLSPSNVAKKAIARKHFRYAIDTTTKNSHNTEPVDNWSIQRISGDTLTEAQIKAKIDAAIAANGWLIVMTHDKELDTQLGGRAAQVAKLGAVIDYCTANAVPIMKFTEAEKYRGNAVALGERTDVKSTFISYQGRTKPNNDRGKWTPTLYGSTVAGAHTYAQQKGFYQVFGAMVVVKAFIQIGAAGLDAAMSGNLRIGGLPFSITSIDNAAFAAVNYNIFNLGANYTTIWAKAQGNFFNLLRDGNNVAEGYLTSGNVVAGQTLNIGFEMVCLNSDDAWV